LAPLYHWSFININPDFLIVQLIILSNDIIKWILGWRSKSMYDFGLLFLAVSIIATIACSSLGLHVLIKNPYLKSTRLFILLTALATLSGLAALLMITAPDESTARFFARPAIFFSTLAGAMLLFLTSYLPYAREGTWLVSHRREFWVLTFFLALVPAVLVSPLNKDQYGWWFSAGLSRAWWWVADYAYYFVGLVILTQLYRRERMEEMKSRISLLIVGTAIPFFSGLLIVPLKLNGQSLPPLLPLIILISSICFAYGIYRQKFFTFEPVREVLRADDHVPSIKQGRGVLVKAKGGDLAYRMFVNELALGGQGLLITRLHPNMVGEAYGLRNTPIIWLATKPGPDSIDPGSISMLRHTTEKFLEKGNNSIILLDGLEFLSIYNSLERVFPFVFGLRDAAVVSGSKFIVTVDPETLLDRELGLLERELDPVML
jgi:hypothetical protein